MKKNRNIQRYIALVSVSIGSKIMFMIPYVMSTYYIVFQNATGFSNSQIGLLMTVLGIFSFIMFLPGGYVADRIPPRIAVPFGLICCGIIGLYIMIKMPSFPVMLVIYGMIPVFITLFTWSSAMKAIRMLGTDEEAGRNQTIRSISIGIVSVSIAIFALGYLSSSSNDLIAYKILMACYSMIIIICGIIFAITFKPVINDDKEKGPLKIKDFVEVLKIKEVLLIGYFGSVVYIAAISLVYLQPYLSYIYNLDSTVTSILGVVCKDISLISAPFMVWLAANRNTSHTKIIALGLFICMLCFAAFTIMPTNKAIFIPSIIIFLTAGFWTMGAWILQFVPIPEIRLPLRITGSAIGVTSVIIHLGDIFYYSLCGRLIDHFGLKGYQIIFFITTLLSLSAVFVAMKVAKNIDKISHEAVKIDHNIASIHVNESVD